MPSRLLTIALACGALAFIGCGASKLNENKSWEIDTGEARALDLPAVSKPQKINIDFTSSDDDIQVLVFKAEDAKGESGMLDAPKEKAIVSKRSKGEAFSVDVPDNTATRVVVRGAGKKTTVNLKVNNNP